MVILAGDIDIKTRAIEWAKQFVKPVLYVLGNHEFYKEQFQKIRKQVQGLTQDTNIYVLDDDEVVIDGVRFLGDTLLTDFALHGAYQAEQVKLVAQFNLNNYRIIQYGPSYRKLRPSDTVAMHERTVLIYASRLHPTL